MSGLFSVADISASGLAAERMRMQVIANNVANANSTRSANGGPYRKQAAVFAPILEGGRRDGTMQGVRVVGIEEIAGEFPKVYDPQHPDAD